MIRSKKILFFLAAALLFAAYLVYDHLSDSPEKRVKKCMNQAIESVEKGDVMGLMSIVSRDYHDTLGLDFAAVSGIAVRTLTKYKDIKVKIINLKIEISGQNAIATFSARADATDATTIRPDGSLPERLSYYKEQVVVRFKSSDGRYLVEETAGVNPNEWGIGF